MGVWGLPSEIPKNLFDFSKISKEWIKFIDKSEILKEGKKNPLAREVEQASGLQKGVEY